MYTASHPTIDDEAWSIRRVLTEGCIGTRFQPIVSMRDRKVIGLEALSYGLNPVTGDRIPPNLLFGRAAEAGQTLSLDRLCRERALMNFGLHFSLAGEFLLWINLETTILEQKIIGTGRFLDAVLAAGLRPNQVIIEIIEKDAADRTALERFVDLYKSHGFFIALDDVGAGHSNLERLALLKPDVLKIDRFLVQDLEREHHKREVVKALRSMAQGIGALVVGEGVETEEEALALMDLDVHLQQGWFFAHPDQSWPDQADQCRARMQSLAARFRERRLAGFNHRKSYYAGICQAVGRIASHLGGSWPDGYEGVLAGAVAGDSRLECLYVLADSGVQLTETVCNSYKLSRSDSALFRPAAKGADLSLKDYYLLVKAGLPRYISDPYISRATGNLCVTVSQPFRGKGGENLIVCADFDCETA